MPQVNCIGNKITDGTNSVTLGGNLSVSGGALTLTLAGSSTLSLPTTGTLSTGGYPVTDVAGTSSGMLSNRAYIASNASLVTLTLPATASVGDVIEVIGSGAGGWKIAQNSGQTIRIVNGAGTTSSTSGATGYLQSLTAADCVTLRCIVQDTSFEVEDGSGNYTIN